MPLLRVALPEYLTVGDGLIDVHVDIEDVRAGRYWVTDINRYWVTAESD